MKPQIVLHPDRPGLEKFMGGLEAKVMEIVWTNKSQTVKRVLHFLSKERTYAYTTVMTIMNRLVKKNFLTRQKVSHAYQYTPVMARDEFIDFAVGNIVVSLKADFHEAWDKALTPGPSRPKGKKR